MAGRLSGARRRFNADSNEMRDTVDESIVQIFADESCLGNQFESPRPGAAAGMVERFSRRDGWQRHDYWRFDPDTTNNRMALWSAILGLSALEDSSRVVFTSDSQYLVKGMKEWIHGWADRGWKRKGGSIDNLDLWKRLARTADRHRVQWNWVRGHDDHPKNEYAHELATRAAEDEESSGGLVPSDFEDWIQDEIDAGRFVDFLDLPPEEGEFEADDPPPQP